MRFSTAIAAAAAFAPLADAHGPPAVPKIMGLDSRDLSDLLNNLKSRNPLSSHAHDSAALDTRASPKECGEGIGSCPQDKCCSLAGYCGTSKDHCYSPGCDYKYGPACPENVVPKGKDTSTIPRPKIGEVPYGGSGIYKCKKPGTVALTYDDGPLKDLTTNILNLFKSYNAKATFFVTGHNIGKGQIDVTDEYVSVIKRMDAEGHQVGSHTWTHLDLSKISKEDRKKQVIHNEMAINNILGKIPTYLRPPYSSCTPESGCQQDLADLGYHTSYFDINTDDYQQVTADKIQNSKDWFKGNMTKDGAVPEKNDHLAISHDIIEQTANNLTEYMLSTLTQLGYKAVTMGECLNDPAENWYRKFGDSADRKGAVGDINNSTTGNSASTNSGSGSTSNSSQVSATSPSTPSPTSSLTVTTQSTEGSATSSGNSNPSQTQSGSPSKTPETVTTAGASASTSVTFMALSMSAILAATLML